ncbi:MAG: hypothetical protein WCW16_03215 [Candidatus Magasanikbacteria bacterium]
MNLKESNYVKIVTSIPVESADVVRNALGEAGAGEQGNYEYCSGSYRQIGRFRPLKGAHPAIGEVGKMEEVEEEVVEVICHKDKLENVIQALRKAHPYEEPAIDIFPRYEIE